MGKLPSFSDIGKIVFVRVLVSNFKQYIPQISSSDTDSKR